MVDYVNLDPSCPLCCAWGALQENFPEDYSTLARLKAKYES